MLSLLSLHAALAWFVPADVAVLAWLAGTIHDRSWRGETTVIVLHATFEGSPAPAPGAYTGVAWHGTGLPIGLSTSGGQPDI
jgi:hypothetical protein